MAIIGDVFPEQRRGSATGVLMTGFAVASVVGVPLGLVVGTNLGWQLAFLLLAISGTPVLALAVYALPRLDEHLSQTKVHAWRSLIDTFDTFTRVNHLNAFALTTALTMSGFLVFPFMSTFFVENVGMSEQQLPLVYIAGGVLTFFASPIVGRMSDRYGKLLMFRVVAPISIILLVCIPWLRPGQIVLAIIAFGMLMVCNVGRMIPATALITSSVLPQRRGAFLSANASIQHIAGGVAAYVGGVIIVQGADQRLEHFPLVGCLSAAFATASLWLIGRLRLAEQPASPADLSPVNTLPIEAVAGHVVKGAGEASDEPLVACTK